MQNTAKRKYSPEASKTSNGLIPVKRMDKSFGLKRVNKLFYTFQVAFNRDGLSQLWNELVRDGEITTGNNNGLINSAGVLSKKGNKCHFISNLFKSSYRLFQPYVCPVLYCKTMKETIHIYNS